MNRVLSFIKESVASLGVANGLLLAVARSLDQATRGRCRLFKYYFVAQPVPTRPVATFSRSSQTRIFMASAGEGIIKRLPRPPEIIARRFADGSVCFIAARAETLVGFIWIKRETYREDEVRCQYVLQPAAQLAWDYDAYVDPLFRMTRAFAQLWEAANKFLREQGCLWSISRISAFNAASLAAHERLGTVHLQTGIFLVAGQVQLSLFSCYPYVHLGLGPGACPQLVLRPPAKRATG
jgi:GNAT superfamily N-acetyltransferase